MSITHVILGDWKWPGIGNESFHTLHIAQKIMKEKLAGFKPGILLDIGAGESPYRYLVPEHLRYVSQDKYDRRADIYCDLKKAPIRPGSVDNIMSINAFEHIRDIDQYIARFYEMLKPGGSVFAIVPSNYPYHSYPDDFYRWTGPGLTELLTRHGFHVVELRPIGTPVETWMQQANYLLRDNIKSQWLRPKITIPLTVLQNISVPVIETCFRAMISMGIIKDEYWAAYPLSYAVIATKDGVKEK
jgi:SAM-dependent methyltransferase